MTPVRLAAPTAGRTNTVGRTVAGIRPRAMRPVPRPMRITPLLRPAEPPLYPSRRDVLRRWEELEVWSCAYCDCAFNEKVVPEVDHIRPLAKGGLHEWANFAPACARCNRLKADQDVGEWLAKTTGEGITVECEPDT